MKMKRTFIALILVIVAGCATHEPEPVVSGIVLGVKEGRRRDAGHGFYTIDVRTKNPPGFWEEDHWGRDLYYKGEKIDESDPPDVSPSGRYAVYESDRLGGMVLFDSATHNKLRVLEDGIGPTVENWSPSETSFRMRYYITGNESTNITVEIKNLKPINQKAKPDGGG